MDYEVLVIKDAKPGRPVKAGQVVTVMPAGHKWSKKERESPFAVIPLAAEPDHVPFLRQDGFNYDFSSRKFKNSDGQEFSRNALVLEADAPPRDELASEREARSIDPDWKKKQPDVCKFLHAKHVPQDRIFLGPSGPRNYNAARQYWLTKFIKLRDLPGMKTFMAGIRYRNYGEIADALRALPKETWAAVQKSEVFTDEDRKWMKWLRRM